MRIEEHVAEQELSLLTREVRADRRRLESLLHAEFCEVGASGRRWTRSELIDALVEAPGDDDVQVADLHSRALSHDVVLVTYTTRRGAARAHRTSLWVRSEHDWTALFHQGTPVPQDG